MKMFEICIAYHNFFYAVIYLNINKKYAHDDTNSVIIFYESLPYQVHFLFGGNPGRSCLPNLRLDDFWQLELRRPTAEQILKKCKLIIRTHKFKELALSNSIEALEYLQTKIFEIIDHDDTQQTREVSR